MALVLAVLLVFSSCSEPENQIPGSVESISVRVVDGTGARTITPDGAVDVTHYMITIHNDAENINQESGYLTKGSMFSVSNVPAGTWYATVDAYIMRGENDYLKVASAQSVAQEVSAGSSVTLTVNLDKNSLLTDVKSGDVTVTLTMPSALAAASTTFYYQYEITGLTDDSFSYSSSITSGTVGSDGTAEITISAETAGLVQGAYRLEITVQDSQTSPAITRKGVDVMRLLPGLAATGAIDLSTYEADQSFQLTITDKIGNKLTPSIQDGEETYTLASGVNTLKVKLVEPVAESETIDWYVDGTVDETVDETNASTGEYTLSFQPGNHNVTAIVRDTATAMAVGSISPFKVSLVNSSIEADLFTFEANDDVEGGSWTVTGTVEGFVQEDSTRFEIPSTYRGLPVTRIAGDAFAGRTDITGQLVLPEQLVEIESGSSSSAAFSNCSGLTGDLLLPDTLKSIGDYAFRDTNISKVEDIEGAKLETIGRGAFANCGKLEHASFVEGLESIGRSAFYGCSLLVSIDIPDSVTSIGGQAFSSCSSLVSIDIPDGVNSIGEYTFWECSSLESITIPNNVTTIEESVFYGCSALVSIDIPDSVTSIGGQAFRYASSLKSITIPNNVTTIEDSVFYGCSALVSINIPDGVTSIGEWAFAGCSSLTGELVIPDSVTSIGYSAFSGCSGFTGDLVIPDSVTSIGDYAFSGCSGFTGNLVIPESITSIGYAAFKDCGSLVSIEIPDSVISIGGSAFSYCVSLVSIKIPDGVDSIGGSTFRGCSSLVNIDIPDSVGSIGSHAFYGCSLLASINIPDGVGSIGEWAFYSCSSLVSIDIPDGVNSIGEYTFWGCSSLESITIPDGLTSIGKRAFHGCSDLNGDLVIPDSVTSIGGEAFLNCSFENITVPWAEDSRPAGWDEWWNSGYRGQIIYSE